MYNAAVNFDYKNTYKNNMFTVYDCATHQYEKPVVSTQDDDNRAGKKTEVYAIRSDDEIRKMIDIFDKKIACADTPTNKKIACRNKMMFVIGMNVGVRASDLRTLTWDFFFNISDDGALTFKDSYNLRPKKTRKKNKYVTLYFNDSVKKIIEWYINMYPISNTHDYIFKSRKGNGAISVDSIRCIIKDVAKEAGIQQNIGSHSMRKSLCRRIYDNAKDKSEALVLLQCMLNHSSQATTLKYLSITNEEIEDMVCDVNIGIDMI